MAKQEPNIIIIKGIRPGLPTPYFQLSYGDVLADYKPVDTDTTRTSTTSGICGINRGAANDGEAIFCRVAQMRKTESEKGCKHLETLRGNC